MPACNITDGIPFTPSLGDYILAYTDGSKIEDGPAGFGTVIKYTLNGETTTTTHCGSLGLHATPYQGEIVAIMAAAMDIVNKQPKVQTLIFTDSQAAIQAINKVSCNILTVLA